MWERHSSADNATNWFLGYTRLLLLAWPTIATTIANSCRCRSTFWLYLFIIWPKRQNRYIYFYACCFSLSVVVMVAYAIGQNFTFSCQQKKGQETAVKMQFNANQCKLWIAWNKGGGKKKNLFPSCSYLWQQQLRGEAEADAAAAGLLSNCHELAICPNLGHLDTFHVRDSPVNKSLSPQVSISDLRHKHTQHTPLVLWLGQKESGVVWHSNADTIKVYIYLFIFCFVFHFCCPRRALSKCTPWSNHSMPVLTATTVTTATTTRRSNG